MVFCPVLPARLHGGAPPQHVRPGADAPQEVWAGDAEIQTQSPPRHPCPVARDAMTRLAMINGNGLPSRDKKIIIGNENFAKKWCFQKVTFSQKIPPQNFLFLFFEIKQFLFKLWLKKGWDDHNGSVYFQGNRGPKMYHFSQRVSDSARSHWDAVHLFSYCLRWWLMIFLSKIEHFYLFPWGTAPMTFPISACFEWNCVPKGRLPNINSGQKSHRFKPPCLGLLGTVHIACLATFLLQQSIFIVPF